MTASVWTAPTRLVPPEAGEIHLWRVRLDEPIDRIPPLRRLLSTDEDDRAGRFHFDIDRHRFIVAHAALRDLIARYRGEKNYLLPFRAGADGKPSLEESGLQFNLAHSRHLGLIAFSGDREVGVDLEAIDREVEVEHIAERFFSAPECRSLLALSPQRRREGFFHIWSQKEAYLKGRGHGVVHGLDHFDVVADPDRPAELLADRHDTSATDRWLLHTIGLEAPFRGALAVEGGPVTVRRYAWR